MPRITYFARTNFRKSGQVFGLYLHDRFYHFYAFGKSGSGKTSLLKTLIKQDINDRHSLCFFDPHGDAVKDIYDSLHPFYKENTTYVDLTNPNLSFYYNPLRRVPENKRSLVASSILDVFKRLWKSAWGLKMEHILRMVLLTLLDQPKADFSSINRIILSDEYRNACMAHIRSKEVRLFWEQEFPKFKTNDLLPILSKTGAFLSHDVVRKVLIENTQGVSLRYLMDNHKVLLINLAKGSVGTDVANIIGSLLLTSLASATFSRIDTPEYLRKPFFIYIDEFQSFTNADLIGELLSESRKFKVGLVLSNQFMAQLDDKVRLSVIGNIGTLVSFRLGIKDAKLMEQEFYPVFKAMDFISLERGSIYLRMMINHRPSRPFSADTII
jgi:type IV secretory pathway TraG/TraD family ATPase VirD4